MKITNYTQLVNGISSFIINDTDYLSTDFVLTNNNNKYSFFLSFEFKSKRKEKGLSFEVFSLILTGVILNKILILFKMIF